MVIDFPRTVRGSLIEPGSPEYDRARPLNVEHNPRPALIARPLDAAALAVLSGASA